MTVYHLESKLKKVENCLLAGKNILRVGMVFLEKDETIEDAKAKYKDVEYPVFFFNLYGENLIRKTVKELLKDGYSREEIKAIIEEEQGPGAADEILKGL